MVTLYGQKQGGSSAAQKVREREGLIRTVGGNLPAKQKPKKSVLRRLSETLDALGGAVRTGLYSSNEGGDFLGSAKEAFFDPSRRKSGSDLLAQQGVENKYVKAIGGFALEMALDPTSYVTFGAGGLFSRGAKIATKAGEVVLNQAGTKLLRSAALKTSRTAAERSMGTLLERSPELAAKFVDPAGIKFAGASLVTGKRLASIAQATGIKTAQNIIGKTALGKTGIALAELVVPDLKLNNELKRVGLNEAQIGQIHKLKRVAQGDKALAMAQRKEFLATNFKKLVQAAPELGMNGSPTMRAKRLAEGLTALRGLPDIQAQYPDNWMAKVAELPEKKQQKYMDALKIQNTLDGAAAPKALQEAYESINKEYDNIADIDFMNGFINEKKPFYAYRGTHRIDDEIVGKGKGKYGVDKGHGKERTFQSILEIDLAKNWDAEWDFLKGVTIRGFQSDANVANKTFLNKIAKIAGVPITKFTPKHQINALEAVVKDTLGTRAFQLMRESGVRSIDDIARMTPSKFARVFEDLPIDQFNRLDVPEGILKVRNKIAQKLTQAEQEALDLSPSPIKKILSLRNQWVKQKDALEEKMSIVMTEQLDNIRERSVPGAIARAESASLKKLQNQIDKIDRVLITEGYAAQVNKIRGIEKALLDTDKAIKAKLLAPLIKDSQKLMEGTVDSIPSGWIDAASLKIPGLQGQFSGLRIPAELGKELTAVGSLFANPQEMSRVLGIFDEYTNVWKSLMTVYFPGYHMRNMVGNIFNASYLAGADITNFKQAADIQLLARQAPDPTKGVLGWDTKIEEIGMTVKELMDEATKQGLRGFGQTTQTLTGKAGQESLDSLVGRTKGIDRIAQGQLGNLKIRALGDTLEENAKLGLFIDRLKKGESFDTAAMDVKKYLFDYGDLTPFERDVLKRVIPFYTWTRKNLPLQIQQAMRTPGKVTGVQRGLDAVERMTSSGYTTEERTLLPDWVSQGLGVKLGDKDAAGVIKTLVGLGLPIEDLNKLDKPGRELLISLAPPLKFLMEEISGKDFYRNKPLDEPTKISEKAGEFLTNNLSRDTLRILGIEKRTSKYGTKYLANGRMVHALAQLPISRLVKTIDTMTNGSKETVAEAMSYLLGANVYDVDLEQSKFFKDKERLEQLDVEIDRLKREGKLGEIEKIFIPKKR